jgi:hypothetical protein
MKTKLCTKCKQDKPLSEFHRFIRRDKVYHSHCKKCNAEYKKQNKVKLWEAQRNRRIGNEKYNEQRKAWNALYYAIKTGKAVKPDKCNICGEPGKIQGHHRDYTKPLEVVWCCQNCHVYFDEFRKAV